MKVTPLCYVNARFLSQRITGSQRYCIEIARRLRRIDPAIRFVAPRDIRHREVADELGAEVVGSRVGVAWEHLDLRRFLRRQGSPLLMSMQYTAPLGYRPSIVTVHDVVFLNTAWVSRRFHYWYRFLIPRVVKAAERVVTVSEFSKREIVAKLGVAPEKVEVVPCAAAPEFAQYALSAGDNPHGRYVLAAATMNKRKNFRALVRAFLKTSAPEVRLVLVGATDARIYGSDPELSGMLDDPRIVLAGYVSDQELAGLYKHAELFLFPSLYEGFGIPPVEAMSVGCPVLTSDRASMPEVCGDAAYLVDPDDEAAITSAIDGLLADDARRREFAAKGLERAKRYDWGRSAERFVELAGAVKSGLSRP